MLKLFECMLTSKLPKIHRIAKTAFAIGMLSKYGQCFLRRFMNEYLKSFFQNKFLYYKCNSFFCVAGFWEFIKESAEKQLKVWTLRKLQTLLPNYFNWKSWKIILSKEKCDNRTCDNERKAVRTVAGSRSCFVVKLFFCSALYVIDLKRFRKLAAGDRLRGQYQVRKGKALVTSVNLSSVDVKTTIGDKNTLEKSW